MGAPRMWIAKKLADGAARFESGFRAAPYRIDAFDAKLADTRRATCAGFLMRRSFTRLFSAASLRGPKSRSDVRASRRGRDGRTGIGIGQLYAGS